MLSSQIQEYSLLQTPNRKHPDSIPWRLMIATSTPAAAFENYAIGLSSGIPNIVWLESWRGCDSSRELCSASTYSNIICSGGYIPAQYNVVK